MIKDLLGAANLIGVVVLIIFGVRSAYIIGKNSHWYDWRKDFLGFVFLSNRTVRNTVIIAVVLLIADQLYTLL